MFLIFITPISIRNVLKSSKWSIQVPNGVQGHGTIAVHLVFMGFSADRCSFTGLVEEPIFVRQVKRNLENDMKLKWSCCFLAFWPDSISLQFDQFACTYMTYIHYTLTPYLVCNFQARIHVQLCENWTLLYWIFTFLLWRYDNTVQIYFNRVPWETLEKNSIYNPIVLVGW